MRTVARSNLHAISTISPQRPPPPFPDPNVPRVVNADDVEILAAAPGPVENGCVVVRVTTLVPTRALVLHKVIADGRVLVPPAVGLLLHGECA